MAETVYKITGTLVDKQRRPLEGLRVELWAPGSSGAALAGGVSGAKGRFEIALDRRHLPQLGPGQAAYFRVFDDDALLRDTKGAVVWSPLDARKKIVIEIDRPVAAPPAELGPQDLLQLQLLAHTTPSALQQTAPGLYAPLVAEALKQTRLRIDEQFAGSSDALRAHVAAVDLKPLATGTGSVPTLLRRVLGAKSLPAAVRAEGLARLAQAELPETLADVLRPGEPVQTNPSFLGVLAQADTVRLAKHLRLDDRTVAALQARSLHPGNLTGEQLDALVKDRVLSDGAARVLGLQANLYVLTQGRLEVMKALEDAAARALGRPVRRLGDLAVLRQAQYVQALQGTGAATAIAAEARRLARALERLFPEQALRARYADSGPGGGRAIAEVLGRNPGVPFLSLDTLDPDAVGRIEFGALKPAERATALEDLRAHQRLHKVTGGAVEDAFALKERGLRTAMDVSRSDARDLSAATGIERGVVEHHIARAQQIVAAGAGVAGTLFDRSRRAMDPPSTRTSGADEQLLKGLPGLADYFGNQRYCRCRECQSVLSPAAYFVDLMEFVADAISVENFGAARPAAPQSLYQRRRDLWSGIRLTCQDTEAIVPYLEIIDKILERYVYAVSRGTDALPPEGEQAIPSHVYRLLYERDRPNGVRQPFSLAVERLEAYLAHFSSTRAELVAAVRGDAAADGVTVQARLGMSQRELDLTRSANAGLGFLQALYGFDQPDATGRTVDVPPTGDVEAFDAQRLLGPLDVRREELTELLATRFVTQGRPIRVEGRRSSEGAVQPDVEVVLGFTAQALDRLHRMARLRRRVSWTTGELDLVLTQLGATGDLPLAEVASLIGLQRRLRVGVEELCALFGRVPGLAVGEGSASLFDRLFNVPPFVRSPADAWAAASFRVPVGTAGPSPTHETLHRLQAGLRVDGATLLALLGEGAGAGLTLDPEGLALLYQHVRLAALLQLPVPDLLQLATLTGGDPARPLTSVAALEARIAAHDAWRRSRLSLDDLAFVIRATPADATGHPDAAGLVSELLETVIGTRALVFADTVFTIFDGVTEEQSRAIVGLNSTALAPARVDAFRVARGLALETVALALPPAYAGISGLEAALRERLVGLAQPGAPVFGRDLFAGMRGLTAADSRSLFAANAGLFEHVPDEALFWLTPDFDPTAPLRVPAGVALSPEAARAHLATFHAAHVVPSLIATALGVASDRLRALLASCGAVPEASAFASSLTAIAQGTAAPAPLVALVDAVARLAVLFRDPSFTATELQFIAEETGRPAPALGVADFRALTFADVRAASTYRDLLGGLREGAGPEGAGLHAALTEFAPAATPPGFTDRGVESVARVLQAERSLVATLNRLLPFPEGALASLAKLGRAVALAQRLGIGGEVLALAAGTDEAGLDRAASALFAAFRARYGSEAEWRTKIEPFEDKLRERRRDALSDYVLRTLAPGRFRSTNDLYHWFLIDTELEGCARTSPVVAGLSTLQLYVQRCLMGLERKPDGTAVTLRPEAAAQWAWRKSYRLWEANRKVFLFPESYLEQELRDDKTEIFRAAESALLQKDLSDASVLDTYAQYLRGFAEIGSLRIAGSYHDRTTPRDVLHLFGVTSEDPPVYYHRTVSNVYLVEGLDKPPGARVTHTAWRKLPLQIPVREVSPVVFLGRLVVFWVEITTQPDQDGTGFAGYRHRLALKFSTLKLDGSWTAPQPVELPVGRESIDDPLADPAERTALATLLFGEGATPSEVVREESVEAFMVTLRKALKRDPSRITETALELPFRGSTITVNATDATVRAVLRPSLADPADQTTHEEALASYTLTAEPWTRVFPENPGFAGPLALVAPPAGSLYVALGNARMRGTVDLYERRLHPSSVTVSHWYGARERRLFRRDAGRIDAGTVPARSLFYPYTHAVMRSRQAPPGDAVALLTSGPPAARLLLVNGSVSDGIVDAGPDVLYAHTIGDGAGYVLKRLGTTLSRKMERILFEEGIDGLLGARTQQTRLAESATAFAFRGEELYDDVRSSIARGVPDFTGPLGVYFREIFFHLPSLIAERLNAEQRFAEAHEWYRRIFDPTSTGEVDLTGVTDPAERARRAQDRVWQYVEFRERRLLTMRELLNDQGALDVSASDPFNPHAIARQRLEAYMRSVVMKCCSNLLDWGDSLFARDTMESINEATLLYVMASDLLGPRPDELGDCGEEPGDATFDGIAAHMRDCPQAPLATIETAATTPLRERPAPGAPPSLGADSDGFAVDPAIIGSALGDPSMAAELPAGVELGPQFQGADWQSRVKIAPGVIASFMSSLLRQACDFCVPPNRELLALWDRVEDRLSKIRCCMNISGIRRQLPLFAPPIDPRLLARARALGVSLDDVLDTATGTLPPYRFGYAIARAKEYAATLQGLGGALVAALEKRDGEELARLRLTQEQNVQGLTTALREQEVAAAEAGLAALHRRRDSIQNRRAHYRGLLETGLSSFETDQVQLLKDTLVTDTIAAPLYVAASIAGAIPAIVGMATSTGSREAALLLQFMAESLKISSSLKQRQSSLAGLEGAYDRRAEGWEFALEQTEDELAEIEKQVVAQEIRVDLARRSLELHQHAMEQTRELVAFYEQKFSSLTLYSYLSRTLQGLYREAYRNAYEMARLAERAYRFERAGDTTPLLRGGYYDVARGGVAAGERLMADLMACERRFMETHDRKLEIDQAFSLAQVDPAALVRLKITGTCEFEVPEIHFDAFYPGQYRRTIQSARLTIPCVTGPYTNVSATLTLLDSYVRREPSLTAPLLMVPPTRTVSIATSSGQNDAGVFRLDFRDERYMPFEGAGAVRSRWRITLPKAFRPFDYSTINDVVLHVSYTAEHDAALGEAVEAANASVTGTLLQVLTTRPLARALSLRQEFSSSFHRLLGTPTSGGAGAPLEISEKHFPLFLQGRRLELEEAWLILDVDPAGFPRSADGRIAWPTVTVTRDDRTLTVPEFEQDPQFGARPASQIRLADNTLDLPRGPVTLKVAVTDAGVLAPRGRPASDPSPLDETKLNDVILFLKYVLAT
jgi:hypothetical protein